MIRYRAGAYEVVVNLGRDPATGKRRQVSRTVRMARQKRIPKDVLHLEATLRLAAQAGEHRPSSATVAEIVDVWLDARRGELSPTTFAGYENSADLYVRPTLGDVRVQKLTTAQVDRLYRDMIARGLSPSTVRGAHTVLRSSLRHAQRLGLVNQNVALLAELPASKPRVIRSATPEQLARLVELADPDLADAVILAATTGARRGELCALRWSDVDLAQAEALIASSVVMVDGAPVVKLPKSGRMRRIGLGPKAVACLDSRLERLRARAETFGVELLPNGFVLSDEPDGSVPLEPAVFSGRFRRLAKKAKLPVHLHMLRHYAATTALASGAAVNDVAAHLGHASAKMTLDVYGHAMPAGRRQVAAALDF